MGTAVSFFAVNDTSQRSNARWAGFFWLLTIVAGVASMSVWTRILVSGNAAATAAKILGSQTLYQLGTTADLFGALFYIAVTLFMYELLKPVDARLSRLGAFFSLAGCAIGGLGCVLQLAPLAILRGPAYLATFTPEQVQSLAYLFVRVRAQTNDVALVFFGLHLLLIGTLLLRSRLVPRAIGALMLFGSLGWLSFIWPDLVRAVFPFNVLPGFIAELTLTLWLLVKGVRSES